MKSVRTFLLFYFAALLVMFLLSSTDAQTQRPPLCNSQFSLANYACSNLPFMELPHSALAPPSPPSDTPPDSPGREHDGDGHNATPKHRHRGGGGHAHRHRAHRTETPSGRDGDDDDNDTDNNDDGGGGGGRDGHGRNNDDDGDDEDDDRELPPMSPAENNCCKWVRDVDDECVCELLMRLPTFLARPFHEYTITVSEWCKVTYSCGGRPRP
ncbi:hypothetical protein LINPERPRIM_LOCUS42937 [Linum perenne]